MISSTTTKRPQGLYWASRAGLITWLGLVGPELVPVWINSNYMVTELLPGLIQMSVIAMDGQSWRNLTSHLQTCSLWLGDTVVHLLGRAQTLDWGKQASTEEHIKIDFKISRCKKERISTTINILLLLGKISG